MPKRTANGRGRRLRQGTASTGLIYGSEKTFGEGRERLVAEDIRAMEDVLSRAKDALKDGQIGPMKEAEKGTDEGVSPEWPKSCTSRLKAASKPIAVGIAEVRDKMVGRMTRLMQSTRT